MRTILSLLLVFSGLLGSAQLPYFKDADWKFRRVGEGEWHNGSKKLDVFASLQNLAPLADPAKGGNDSLNKIVEISDWEFEKEFLVSDKKSFGWLILEGPDTYADVFVNGEMVLQTNNAFRDYRVDVSKLVKEGTNSIRILFHSPITHDLPQAQSASFTYPADSDKHPKKTSVFTRKPAFHFGWDFAPRRVNCSVKDVKIEPASSFYINDFVITSRPTDDITVLKIEAEIWSEKSQSVELGFALDSLTAGKGFSLQKGMNKLTMEFGITNPKRWWSNGLGTPNLYHAKLSCTKGSERQQMTRQVGFRTVKLLQEKDSIGTSFKFVVNGKPIFAKGVNYIQGDHSISENEVKVWKDAGMNMVRVWGGGNYGDNTLYDLCDRYGILVWQDFMFANTMYPADPVFLQSVSAEAAEQIKRLRNHPSLALWCGNNEIEVAWKNWGWQSTYKYSTEDSTKLITDYNKLFKEVLPQLVDSLDKNHAYISSSPISNWGKAEDFTIGDNHYWGVYHGELPISAYNDFIPRFASEYGMQSYPDIETLMEFIPAEELVLKNTKVDALQLSYKGNALLEKYQKLYTGEAKDLSDFIYKSQVIQAEAMKMAIAAHRRAKGLCMGSLLWQWNDVAPAASWSLVDVKGRKKAAYLVALNAFRSWMVSPIIKDGNVEVWMGNENARPATVALSLTLKDFKEKIIKRIIIDVPVTTGEMKKVYSEDLSYWIKPEEKSIYYLECEVNAQTTRDPLLAREVLYFDALKNLKLADPEFMIQNVSGGQLVSWRNHAVYPQITVAGESYYVDPKERFILLPLDHNYKPEIKARSFGFAYTLH